MHLIAFPGATPRQARRQQAEGLLKSAYSLLACGSPAFLPNTKPTSDRASPRAKRESSWFQPESSPGRPSGDPGPTCQAFSQFSFFRGIGGGRSGFAGTPAEVSSQFSFKIGLFP